MMFLYLTALCPRSNTGGRNDKGNGIISVIICSSEAARLNCNEDMLLIGQERQRMDCMDEVILLLLK